MPELADPDAKLVSNPRSLLRLWHEFVHGLEGHKPAKDFTSHERGKTKYKYNRRKIFWELMVKLINCGMVEVDAIDLIRQCYGRRLSVTGIINKIMQDRRRGAYHTNIAALGVTPPTNVRGGRNVRTVDV
jgi:hypothetical protein